MSQKCVVGQEIRLLLPDCFSSERMGSGDVNRQAGIFTHLASEVVLFVWQYHKQVT